MPWENTMSGTRDPGAMLVGQCRRAGTARERAESTQSNQRKRARLTALALDLQERRP